jgi:DNA invertase Pin-like site-specific DNA recombinase
VRELGAAIITAPNRSKNPKLFCGFLLTQADNGVGGTTFNRPALLRLIKDIEAGTVDTLIVYDFSRFSRSFIEASRFVESVFPKYGVRFISVMDGFDSADSEDEMGYMATGNPLRFILDFHKQVNLE